MGTAGKLVVLVVVAAVTFGIAVVALSGGDDPAAGGSPAADAGAATSPAAAAPTEPASPSCRGPAQEDPSYEVSVTSEPDPPRAEGTTFRLTVTRDGQPVTDALVCLVADMRDMAHEGVVARGTESSPGTYELSTGFVMRGGWDGTVRVVPPDGGAVRVPLPLTVQ